MPSIVINRDTINIIELVNQAKLSVSTSETRRLIAQGAISFDGEKVEDVKKDVSPKEEGSVLKVGKRRFCRVLRK